ncbi:hypothetical protein TWF506_010231 [Arthrobotrys conoides]|uniref:Ankyrin repeat protein n=1 Tax=Arthrobotrys conoides TaxID=74498 RepID=A0AAN8RVP3_9PEZI
MEVTPTPEVLEKEQSLLHLAIMCKSADVLASIETFGVNINLPGEAKRPLLHFALSYESNDTSWIPIFCMYGIEIDAVDKDSKTALAIEIENSNTLTANALIDKRAKWRQQEETPESSYEIR